MLSSPYPSGYGGAPQSPHLNATQWGQRARPIGSRVGQVGRVASSVARNTGTFGKKAVKTTKSRGMAAGSSATKSYKNRMGKVGDWGAEKGIAGRVDNLEQGYFNALSYRMPGGQGLINALQGSFGHKGEDTVSDLMIALQRSRNV